MQLLKNRWVILFAFLVPLNVLYGFDRSALALVTVPVKNELGIGYVLMSQIVVISTAVYACLQVPAGWLASRIGVRWAMGAACILWSGATYLTSIQTGVTGFFIARVLLGIGQAPDWVTCILAIKILFPEVEREKANSMILAALYIGLVVCGTLTPWIAEHSGWRSCFSLYGAIGLVFGIGVLLFYQGENHEAVVEAVEKPVERAGWRAWVNLAVGQGAMYYFALSMLFAFVGITFPHFANSVYHLSPLHAGRLTSILWAVLYLSVIASGLLIKYLKYRDRARWVYGAWGRSLSLLAGAGFISAGIVADNLLVSMLLMSLAMAFIALCQVLIWTYVQGLSQTTGIAAGIVMLFGNGSIAIAPVLFEVLYTQYQSWLPSSAVIAMTGLIGGCAWLNLRAARNPESLTAQRQIGRDEDRKVHVGR